MTSSVLPPTPQELRLQKLDLLQNESIWWKSSILQSKLVNRRNVRGMFLMLLEKSLNLSPSNVSKAFLS